MDKRIKVHVVPIKKAEYIELIQGNPRLNSLSNSTAADPLAGGRYPDDSGLRRRADGPNWQSDAQRGQEVAVTPRKLVANNWKRTGSCVKQRQPAGACGNITNKLSFKHNRTLTRDQLSSHL